MTETATILASLAPVFLVMAMGYAAGRTKEFDNHNIGSLNALVMDFALPAALFTAMAQAPRQAMIDQARLALVLLGTMLLAFAVTYFVQVRLLGGDRRESALIALTASGPNVGSAGLPIVAALFNKSASISVAVAVAVAAIVLTPLSLLLLESCAGKSRNAMSIVTAALAKPIVIAPLLGLLWSLAGLSLPPLIDGTLTLVGQGASGTALFLTGLVLSAQPIQFRAEVGLAVMTKNILQPLMTALLAIPLLDHMEARVAIMLMAVPSGAFGVLFAIRYNVASPRVGTTLIVSTIASVATLTTAILLSATL
ncbi:AEC family transporter [Bradyrhizobium japonicum]|uniref:AEC family transporter n=1 Tax=Bradyrhizobium japonicum TaxID=375 RepID=UPI001BADB871|nr:AEC family transporter [Bradyrhizobium japonicum]MBR0910344.1 AEC family transporter [Bradyrhizobium japonicum]